MTTSTGDDLSAFSLSGALPGPGITLLEASAGTGKTFTIAALMTRLIAEGAAEVSDILAVTFTRMATSELRDRIRNRLVSTEEGLSRRLEAGSLPADVDEVLEALAEGPVEMVRQRHQNVARALATFDAATITTTHGFCQLVLSGMGVAGQVAEGAVLLEDPHDMVQEVVDDIYVQRALMSPPPFSRREAGVVGWSAVSNAGTALEPASEELRNEVPGRRRRLAERVRKETHRRLSEANLLTYDELLMRLRDTLADPERGELACLRLRQRYRVVLVDEFQDTDPVQWEVVQRAFGDGGTILVLIGDPKQAIYAFRGADVFAYLAAAGTAAQRFTLATNWRSDDALLRGLAALFGTLHLGHADIPYRPVAASPDHARPGLEGAPSAAALRLRMVHRRQHQIERTTKGLYQKTALVEWVAEDLAADIVRLLSSGAELVERDREGQDKHSRPVRPGDVAVLVKTNRQSFLVQEALKKVGVPAVVAAAESVFRTASARHWLWLLEALEQPADRSRAVLLALSAFIGMTGDEVASAADADWDRVHERIHQWEGLLKQDGVSALARGVMVSEGMAARLLRHEDGERLLTDLAHVGQLLHTEAGRSQAGLAGLRSWLARRVEEAGRDETDAEDRARRLDTDAEAVQVLTVHRAKGLEFPVVYCPYLWDVGRKIEKTGPPIVFHDQAGQRHLDVGGSGRLNPGYDRHFDAYKAELRGEDLRHLYVALTRAKNQCVIWWGATQDCRHSALGRLLLARSADGTVAPDGPAREPSDEEFLKRLEEVLARAPEVVAIESAGGPDHIRWSPVHSELPGRLDIAHLSRALDRWWRRTSYTGITAGAHDRLISSEPEDPGLVDEPQPGVLAGPAPAWALGPSALASAPDAGAGDESALRAVISPWAGLPGGADVGTFVHGVLEKTDFAAADLSAVVAGALALQGHRVGPRMPGPELAGALAAAITTPLGPLAGEARLADIARADRLDELGFELPLAGGDEPSGQVAMQDLAAVVAEHGESDGVLAGYAERLRDPDLSSVLRGYLTGSIDLVFRQPAGEGGQARYFIVDYKTNWLGPEGEELSAWHYRPVALGVEMQRLHYPLQGLLYSVALHRYLRWRLKGYDPRRNLGGMLYLFLRGMTGPDVPTIGGQPCGVFSWATPPDLVIALSDLLDGRPGRVPARAGA